MEKIFYLILVIVLVYWSIQDIRYMKIRIIELIILSVASYATLFFRGKVEMVYILGCIPGIISVFISKVSAEKIGFADGGVLLVIGGITGIWGVLNIWIYAAFLAGIIGLFLIVKKKAGRTTKIPFVPFLTLGLLIQIVVQMVPSL